MRVLYAYLCVFCTHIYACFVRIYMRVLYTYICVFCTHIHASKRHIYIYAFKVFGEKYTLEPIYHEPIFKQMANHITLGNGFVNSQGGKPLFITFCGTVYEMAKNIEKTEWRRCVKHHLYIRALNIADLLFQFHE